MPRRAGVLDELLHKVRKGGFILDEFDDAVEKTQARSRIINQLKPTPIAC
jgi:hypothetical protein